ncbi:MAG TPA: hypothetical protein VN695_15060 [Streptosporangiaceae bacterium]|nr:hypothetical protein [Streptosporangiaceae bacterium]
MACSTDQALQHFALFYQDLDDYALAIADFLQAGATTTKLPHGPAPALPHRPAPPCCSGLEISSGSAAVPTRPAMMPRAGFCDNVDP